MMDQVLIDFFESQNMLPEGFVEYMNAGRIRKYPDDISWFCCMTKVENNILVELSVIVPKIVDLRTMLINIHEYTHEIELFDKLNTPYLEDVEKSEAFAKSMELVYKKAINK